MKVRRTKNQIIAAIETNLANGRLTSGTWLTVDSDPENGNFCEACAVGSVFMDCVEPNRMDLETKSKMESFVQQSFIGEKKRKEDVKLYREAFEASPFNESVAVDYVIGGPRLANKSVEDIEKIRAVLKKHKRWLDLLSNVFETEYAKAWVTLNTNYVARSKLAAEKTIEYVKANFPRSITIDIDGFDPKPGVQVVKPKEKKQEQV